MAVSFRSIIAEQKKEPGNDGRYYISLADLTAEKFASNPGNHWHVRENKANWRLDVVMNEDDCNKKRNAAESFCWHIAINILTK